MEHSFQKKILNMAIYAGEIMMKNGAEVYRVEDTVARICKAYGIANVEVFAMPTGIFASVDNGGNDDDAIAYVKRIKSRGLDLNKISKVNDFSRKLASSAATRDDIKTTTPSPEGLKAVMSVEDGMKTLEDIDKLKEYPLAVRFLGAGMISSFFCAIFGGGLIDFFVALLAGFAGYAAYTLFNRFQMNSFIVSFLCCSVCAFIALAASSAISDASYEPIIIGSIMIFVPGVATTNSIRDFLAGDMVAGVARLTEAVFTAVALAAGAGVMIKLWIEMGGVVL